MCVIVEDEEGQGEVRKSQMVVFLPRTNETNPRCNALADGKRSDFGICWENRNSGRRVFIYVTETYPEIRIKKPESKYIDSSSR